MNILQSLGLSIIIGTKLIETEILDVSSNLHTEKYAPFKKPNDTSLYIYISKNSTTHHQLSRNFHE